MPDYEFLLAKANALRESITNVVGNVDLSWDSKLNEQLQLLKNRMNEIDSKAFVVIVVGPAKSGKSTFVNLLAHSIVSPTHFLECTVRPSIISKKTNGKCSIKTYTLQKDKVDKGGESIDYLDLVIDAIKGLPVADLHDVKVDEYEFNDDNLKNYVEWSIDDFYKNENERKFLTSITAEGGSFLQDDIYLVDMPGFDGIKANLDKDYYKTIINRADLVIFIQSSNSAITKVSDEFFEILKDRNSVPVYLIHNLFESAYWRNPKLNDSNLNVQIEEAKWRIRDKGFTLSDDHCLSINLGKVDDYKNMDEESIVKPEFKEELEESNAKFKELECVLYEDISSSQQITRLNNCIDNIEKAKQKLVSVLETKISELKSILEKYEEAKRIFSEIRNDSDLVCNDDDFVLNINADNLCATIRGLFESLVLHLPARCVYWRNDIRQKVDDLQASIIAKQFVEAVNMSIANQKDFVRLDEKSQNWFNNIKTRIVTSFLTTKVVLNPIPDFGDSNEFQIDTSLIQESYNSKERVKTILPVGKDKLVFYLNEALTSAIGYINAEGKYVNGIIQDKMIPNTKTEYHQFMKEKVEKRKDKCIGYINEQEEKILNIIEPDIEIRKKRMAELEDLRSKLN